MLVTSHTKALSRPPSVRSPKEGIVLAAPAAGFHRSRSPRDEPAYLELIRLHTATGRLSDIASTNQPSKHKLQICQHLEHCSIHGCCQAAQTLGQAAKWTAADDEPCLLMCLHFCIRPMHMRCFGIAWRGIRPSQANSLEARLATPEQHPDPKTLSCSLQSSCS